MFFRILNIFSNVAISLCDAIELTPSKCRHRSVALDATQTLFYIAIGKTFSSRWGDFDIKYLMHFQMYTDPTKQLMLEVVDGPSVRFLFNFNHLLLSVFHLFFYLPTITNKLSAENTNRREYQQRRRILWLKSDPNHYQKLMMMSEVF